MYQSNDFSCEDCKCTITELVKKEDRELPIKCHLCGGIAHRIFPTAVNVRTEKLSKTYINGNRPDIKEFNEYQKGLDLKIKLARDKTLSKDDKIEIKKELKDRKQT